MEDRAPEIASQLFFRCIHADDQVDCLERQIALLRSGGQWSEQQLADIEKQVLRMLFEALN